ncbi:MAG: phage tail tip lysozyme [Paracoccaceae bacterium]
MTFFLEEQTADAATEATPPPTFGERFAAAATKTRIEDDSWGRKRSFEDDLAEQLIAVLPDDLRAEMQRPYAPYEMPSHRRAELFDKLAEAKDRDPEKYGRTPDGEGGFAFPGSEEEFVAIVSARRQAEYDEQVRILSAAPEGSWGAEFLGSSWASLTEEKSLLTLMLGAPARTGVAGTALIEGALGGAQEIFMIDQRQRVADELDVAQPNPILDVAMATATAGILGGAIKGAGRFIEYRAARGRAAADARLPDESPAIQEGMIESTRKRIEEGGPADPAAERVAPAGTAPKVADFDFSLTGNASPRTNRVGYVYGKLIAAGIEPHIAAGMVGNGMVEAGPGLHTAAVGDGGNALGMFQWNGVRKRALEDFAAGRGKPATDLDTQIDFLLHEIRTTEAGAWARIRQAKTPEEAAQLFSDLFERPGIPHNERRIAHARDIWAQYQDGRIPRWTGKAPPPEADAPRFATSRGFTRDGQVVAGDTRIDVRYEVVDASVLRRATGDLQPRDRSRAASDEQIAEIAAQHDPARRLPAPEADRGAPVVGPDGVIESGNGRVAAIQRAYERHPDRADAYRAEIEGAGFEIPEGVREPVLVARRTSDLDAPARQRFVREANNATVARMSPTERAGADAAALSEDAIALYAPGQAIAGPANRAFAKAALEALPQAERNALVDAGGALNAEGVRRLQAALFARAWDAPDIVARFAEADAGELRSLIDALADAAPAWAALRADIAAGRVQPGYDIGPFVLDAMRLIALARETATAEGKALGGVIAELLSDIDLFEGALSPLTAALVRKFWRAGRAAPKDEVAGFLTRYANEARKVGTTEEGLFGDAPGPADVLRAIDKDAFADLPDDLGRPRGRPAPVEEPAPMAETAYAAGADSPEAIEADLAAIEDLRGGATSAAMPDLAEVDPQDFVFELSQAQPFDDLDTAIRLADGAQRQLVDAGHEISDALGVEFKNPGLKERAKLDEKVARKGYNSPRQLTDIARAGFVVTSRSEADAVAGALAARFDIVDEGWKRLPSGYIDRKVVIRHDDGMLSEIQIWTQAMWAAKKKGTPFYDISRDTGRPSAERTAAFHEQTKIYSAATEGFTADEFGAGGMASVPNLRLKEAAKDASSAKVPADDQTSLASTGTQSAPGSSMASADMGTPSSLVKRTAGRRSQSQNSVFMGGNPPFEDNPNMGALRAEVNALRDDFGHLTFQIDENGPEITVADLLDDIEADEDLAQILKLCNLGGVA